MRFKKIKFSVASYLVDGNYNLTLKFSKKGKISVNYKPLFLGKSKSFKFNEEDSIKLDRKLRNLNLDKISSNVNDGSLFDGEEWETVIFYDDLPTQKFKIKMPFTKEWLKVKEIVNLVIKKGEIDYGLSKSKRNSA